MLALFFAATMSGLVPKGRIDIRVLVALEDNYRVYRETIAAGLRILRPHDDVKDAPLGSLEEELERFDPQVVICSGHSELEQRDRRAAWVELSLDPTQLTKISVGGRHFERTNPTVGELLEIIGEPE